ncbi:DUF1013 domain-containing protein [Candidatus Cyrtobacter comes]|uniref:DUF1013 domain-containing protein n=1 Tax=Candidatus Cyrtobacter comes TaxID=675776 RepID=A0ABU5L6T5_9RICK|nr:DUF1013 domain-containing protein [Candidatus Cyrtobacter comes]
MTQNVPLMPKATATWLIKNTSLTFKQIADFCGFHVAEIQGMADGEVARGIKEISPIHNNQLTYEEIKRCEADSTVMLRFSDHATRMMVKEKKKRKTSKYVPVARRQDKPNAAYWLLKSLPQISVFQIAKLIGSTKATVSSIKDKTYKNFASIQAKDPVLLGLCSQTDLDKLVESISPHHDKDDIKQPD